MTLPAVVVATDLDGTLLRTDGTLSARTRAALAAAEDAGVHVVVVTARPPRWMHHLGGVVGRHGVTVCSNGAYVYRLPDRVLLAEHPLAPEVAMDIAADLRAALPGTALAVENALGFAREPGFPLHPTDAAVVRELPPGLPSDAHVNPYLVDVVPPAPLDRLLDPPPGKLMARHPTLPPDEFLARVGAVVGERAVLAYSGAGGLAELSAPGVTKASALATWCTTLGVRAADVWAFGDMPNDLPMLRWAGVAHAVANAHPDVLAVADVVCPSNDDDGVARTLEAVLAG